MIDVFPFAHYLVAVFGLGRSGLSSATALKNSEAEVEAWDDDEDARAAAAEAGVPLVDLYKCDWKEHTTLVLSPGIPLNHPEPHKIVQMARAANVEVIGDIELLARTQREAAYIGITGTNGKSTTTALTHHILKTAGVPTTMGGNIGLPILEQEPLPEGGVYVLELSSYQIDLTYSLDCDVAVLLNITPDHLDRYDGDFDAYAASKSRLFAMQMRGHNSIARFADARSLGHFAEGSIASILEDVLANRGIEPGEQSDAVSIAGRRL